ncbi:MAG: hypothetical protein JSU81_05490, partial [Candidatus Coatesbacteria bacterium]
MEKLLRGAASVARAAAVVIILAATALAYPVRILGSFRVCGTAAPYARGIHVPGYWYCIFYAADRYNYLHKYDTSGSLLSTVRLAGAVRLGDAGFGPPGFQLHSNFGVLDEGARNVKVYDLAGSFVGTWRAVTSDTVAYARWGYDHKYAYLGTRDGRI